MIVEVEAGARAGTPIKVEGVERQGTFWRPSNLFKVYLLLKRVGENTTAVSVCGSFMRYRKVRN